MDVTFQEPGYDVSPEKPRDLKADDGAERTARHGIERPGKRSEDAASQSKLGMGLTTTERAMTAMKPTGAKAPAS